MPGEKGYGTGSKEMFDKALKDGLITKKQMNNLHPNLVVAIIKKKRASGSSGTGGAGASRDKGTTRKAKPSGPKNASKVPKGKKGKK
tara:strand:+ start:303 stop:563 length:261 start_codon:yes stop_codon:yes gene_type:complete